MSLLNLEIAVPPRFHFDQVLETSVRPTKIEFSIPKDLIRRMAWCGVLMPDGSFPVANSVQGYLEFTLGGASRGSMKFDYGDAQVIPAHNTTVGFPDCLAVINGGLPNFVSPLLFNSQADKVAWRLEGRETNFPIGYMLFLAVRSEYPL